MRSSRWIVGERRTRRIRNDNPTMLSSRNSGPRMAQPLNSRSRHYCGWSVLRALAKGGYHRRPTARYGEGGRHGRLIGCRQHRTRPFLERRDLLEVLCGRSGTSVISPLFLIASHTCLAWKASPKSLRPDALHECAFQPPPLPFSDARMEAAWLVICRSFPRLAACSSCLGHWIRTSLSV